MANNPDSFGDVEILEDLFDEFHDLYKKIKVRADALLDRDAGNVAQLVQVLSDIIKLYEEPPNIYTRELFDAAITKAKSLIHTVDA